MTQQRTRAGMGIRCNTTTNTFDIVVYSKPTSTDKIMTLNVQTSGDADGWANFDESRRSGTVCIPAIDFQQLRDNIPTGSRVNVSYTYAYDDSPNDCYGMYLETAAVFIEFTTTDEARAKSLAETSFLPIHRAGNARPLRQGADFLDLIMYRGFSNNLLAAIRVTVVPEGHVCSGNMDESTMIASLSVTRHKLEQLKDKTTKSAIVNFIYDHSSGKIGWFACGDLVVVGTECAPRGKEDQSVAYGGSTPASPVAAALCRGSGEL